MTAGLILLAAACAVAGDDEGARLRRQVKFLSAELAVARAESDALKALLDERVRNWAGRFGLMSSNTGVREKEFRVLDVNKDLGMVILDGGRRDGIKPGLQFAVLEKGRTVATVRIVDVRTAVAGAVIQDVDRGAPAVDDRAVLVTGSRK